MNNLRIVSFLPAATEMAYALGLADQLVGVSHECDFPADAKTKPVVVRCSLPVETMSLNEIDVAVAECIGRGGNLYEVDQPAIEQLAPTHILTQVLCQVCAPSDGEITQALNSRPACPMQFQFRLARYCGWPEWPLLARRRWKAAPPISLRQWCPCPPNRRR